MPKHKPLGKIFAAFKHCCMLYRADHRDVSKVRVRKESIMYTIDKWIFRPNDHHFDVVSKHSLFNGGKISCLDGEISSETGSSCISGGNKQAGKKRTLNEFPCQGMFAAAGTKQEDFHRNQDFTAFSMDSQSRSAVCCQENISFRRRPLTISSCRILSYWYAL